VPEGERATLTAQAGGAQKSIDHQARGQETIVGVDQFSYTFDAGRVVGRPIAVPPVQGGVCRRDQDQGHPCHSQRGDPEPALTLKRLRTGMAGRRLRSCEARQLAQMQAKGAGNLNYKWSVSGLAVIKEIVPGKLIPSAPRTAAR